jgi:DmsE family decaheme c-type cytochrome
VATEAKADVQGCESCHGDTAAHLSEPSAQNILNPARLPPQEAAATCQSCHGSGSDRGHMFWAGSEHAMADLTCASCHSIHQPKAEQNLLKAEAEVQLCMSCHAEVRATLLKRSRHPLFDHTREAGAAAMKCSDCHEPHGSAGPGLLRAQTVNDTCYRCHAEFRAPVLWEHAPVKENCLNCHAAHGSNQEHLLVTYEQRLCQSCHLQGRHQTVAGSPQDIWAINRSCTNCHSLIHGSNHPSGLKLTP